MCLEIEHNKKQWSIVSDAAPHLGHKGLIVRIIAANLALSGNLACMILHRKVFSLGWRLDFHINLVKGKSTAFLDKI